MFDKSYEQRLQAWSNFRDTLETAQNPIQTAIDNYNQAPIVSIQTDPWDQSTWPSPWELVLENQYCDFCKLLGICYSLQLTDRFSDTPFEIHIAVDKQREQSYYLLFVNEYVIGYNEVSCVFKDDLPATLESQTVYTMRPLN